ncbi:ScbR family autoregulator-binding transcription factor [Actinophytocola sp. NPDC049390]|uniref:ScbR family autoregulator-binding transcription factor n=1 Tax=Actinophytocola sp. NPDC049390 TaxID=3363894 RepID=UPI0037B04D22
MAKQSRSESTRLHLVRSAAVLFDRLGFSGATLEDVSRSAGVTKGAFYFHFSSKDELGGAIQAEACGLLRSAVYGVVGAGLPALQALVDLTHELAWWLECEPLVRASFRTARECGHRGRPFLDFHHEWLVAVELLLRQAQRAGELAPDVELEHAVTLVVTVTAGMELLWWAKIREGALGDSLTGMWSLALPGLAAPALVRRLRPAGTGRSAG